MIYKLLVWAALHVPAAGSGSCGVFNALLMAVLFNESTFSFDGLRDGAVRGCSLTGAYQSAIKLLLAVP